MATGLIREGPMPYINMGFVLHGSLRQLFKTFLCMAKGVVFYCAAFLVGWGGVEMLLVVNK
jgi:hypothetical protein